MKRVLALGCVSLAIACGDGSAGKSLLDSSGPSGGSAGSTTASVGGSGGSTNGSGGTLVGSAGNSVSSGGVSVAGTNAGGANAAGVPSGGAGASGGAGGSNGGGTGVAGSNSAGAPASGGVTRPAYNKGKGFFVVGNKLYDASGAEFRIRGLNKLHWDAGAPGIPKTHANTERWTIDFKQSAKTNSDLMQQSIGNHIVPMPGNWGGTCSDQASTLTTMVDTWVAQAATWTAFEKYIIINIANEWGPAYPSTVWRDEYIKAIGRLRDAGYHSTISITSGGCGQDNATLVNYAKAVFDSDPEKNVIFDQHIYGGWVNSGGQSWQTKLATGLDNLVALGLPVIVGEFGPGRNIGPSPTMLTPGQIIQACEARGIGWMAWAWDDNPGAGDTWFALSKTSNGDYTASSDLTMFGKEVVENPTYGLLKLAAPAAIF